MPDIKQLPPHLADLIAAGEVVERPASVVKELVENAIDAGATGLTVEIEHGGMALIRVTDNGCGIAPEQAETAFLRHATSKISDAHDLEAIGTLGFRGEALAAISAVSRVELLTKTADAPLGLSLTLEGGAVTGREEAGCPDGTTMVVRDLFFNTPARLKFMKKGSAEGAAVFAVVQRLALSRPDLSVKFLRDGKQEMSTPGNGKLKDAVYAVLGRDLALGFTEVLDAGGDLSVGGYVSLPACCRGSRSCQYCFVNGRYVKSGVMVAALEEAYKNQKMVGRFPGCVLHLSVPADFVDVNVHPAKTEVKFKNEHQVFTTVYCGVQAALNGNRARPQASLFAAKSRDTVTPNQTAMALHDSATELPDAPPPPARGQSVPAGTSQSAAPSEGDAPVWRPAPTYRPAPRGNPSAKPSARKGAAPRFASPFRHVAPLPPEHAPAREEPPAAPPPREDLPLPTPETAAAPPKPETNPAPPQDAPAEPQPWILRGELFNTYVLVEQGDKVILIDKHAAHERANFDRLKAEGYQPMVQELLTPVVFTPAPEERETLLEHLDLLTRFGFELEEFGSAALAVRAAPDYLDAGALEGALTELAQRIALTGGADPDAARDELMHTMACKAAIKGGQKNGRDELLEVARLVMSGQVRYCPHGRPVAIELTRKQLEKQFKRT